MRLGCDKLLENGFIGNGDVRKWMEAGFLLNVRRKSNEEPACMGLKRKQQLVSASLAPLDEHRLFHLPYHTGSQGARNWVSLIPCIGSETLAALENMHDYLRSNVMSVFTSQIVSLDTWPQKTR